MGIFRFNLCQKCIVLDNNHQIYEIKYPCHFEKILLKLPKDTFLRTRNKFLSE